MILNLQIPFRISLQLLLFITLGAGSAHSEDFVTILSQEHSLNVFASSAKGYEQSYYDTKGKRTISDLQTGRRIDTTITTPDPEFAITKRQVEQNGEPVGEGQQYSLSLKASVPGGASASGSVHTLAGMNGGGVFVIDGTLATSAQTSVSPGWGATARAKAEFLIAVRITGPSVVYVRHCDGVEIGYMPPDKIVRYADVCRVQTKGMDIPLSAEFLENSREILGQMSGGEQFDLTAMSDTGITFEIHTSSFQSSESTTPDKTQPISIEIVPGCPIAFLGDGNSPIYGMLLTGVTSELPEVTIFDQTTRGRELIGGEVELSRTEYFSPDSKRFAERAAGNINNPIETEINLTVDGPGDASGVHTVLLEITDEYQETFRFDFADFDSMKEVEAFINTVLAAIREATNGC